MKQYRVTYKVEDSHIDDCVLCEDDPIHDIKEEQFLGKLANFDVEAVELKNESI
jgi:hypothetical protein